MGERELNDALARSFTKAFDELAHKSFDTVTTARQSTASLDIKALEDAIDHLKKGDTLQQRGVGRDWFCVINPALVSSIRNTAKEYLTVPPYVMPDFDLDYIMGRRVLVVSEAPMQIEYMSEEVAKSKYPAYFEEVTE